MKHKRIHRVETTETPIVVATVGYCDRFIIKARLANHKQEADAR